MLEFLKISGALLGIVAFVWRVNDALISYLHIDIRASVSEGSIFATAVVENKGIRSKKIDNALLLIGPENEDPIDTFNMVSSESGLDIKASSTNDIAAHRLSHPIECSEGRQIIPLGFFYSENIRVGDERLTYSTPISKDKINYGMPYSVRFYVWDSSRLHRSNQDCFQIDKVDANVT